MVRRKGSKKPKDFKLEKEEEDPTPSAQPTEPEREPENDPVTQGEVCVFLYFLCKSLKDHLVVEFPYPDQRPHRVTFNWLNNHCMVMHLVMPLDQRAVFKLKTSTFWATHYENNYTERSVDHSRPWHAFWVNEKFDNLWGRNSVLEARTPEHHIRIIRSVCTYFGKNLVEQISGVNYIWAQLLRLPTCTASDMRRDQLQIDVNDALTRELDVDPSAQFVLRVLVARHLAVRSEIRACNLRFDRALIECGLPLILPYHHLLVATREILMKADRVPGGYFLLLLALTHPSLEWQEKAAKSFRSYCGGTFTDDERELMSRASDERPGWQPSQVCVSLKMANQIDQIDQTAALLLSRAYQEEYRMTLRSMDSKDYLQEWMWCLAHVRPQEECNELFLLKSERLRPLMNRSFDTEVMKPLLSAAEKCRNGAWLSDIIKQLGENLQQNSGHKSQEYVTHVYQLAQYATSDALAHVIHQLLPVSDDNRLIHRIRRTSRSSADPVLFTNAFYKLESAAIVRIVCGLPRSKEILEQYYQETRKLIEYPFGLRIFSIIWKRRFDLYGEKPLNSDWIRGVFSAVRSPGDVTDSYLPQLLQEPLLVTLIEDVKGLTLFEHAPLVQSVLADVKRFTESIREGNILPSLLRQLTNPKVKPQLQQLSIPMVLLDELTKKLDDRAAKWTLILNAYELMREREQFEQLAEVEFERLQRIRSKLELCPIKDWDPPDVNPSLLDVGKKLEQARFSNIFQKLWRDPSFAERNEVHQDQPLSDQWVSYVQLYLDRWEQLMQAIAQEAILCSDVRVFFDHVFFQMDLRSGQLTTRKEEEIRRELERSLSTKKERLKEDCEKEVRLISVVNSEQFQSQKMYEFLTNCIDGIDSRNDIIALRELCGIYNIPIAEELQQFCDLFGPNWEEKTTAAAVGAAYQRIDNSIRNIIRGYPSLYLEVMHKDKKLLDILKQFSSVRALNQRLDNRQSEDIRPETHDNLHALRLVAQSIMNHKHFAALRENSQNRLTLEQFLQFFVETGSAVVALVSIRNSKESLQDALQSESEEKQTIAIVKNLLVHGGAFLLDICDGKVTVSAQHHVFTEETGEKTVIRPEELESLPSQLLLTSGVQTKYDMEANVDEPLPENISRLEDRERYVLRFNKLFDTAYQLADVVKLLCQAGDLKFQNNCVKIDLRMKVSDLQQEVQANLERLDRWESKFTSFRSAHPLLSFFSRSQLVSCLAALKNADKNSLFSTLLSLGCKSQLLPVLEKEMESARGIVDASVLFERLNDLVCRFFDHEKLEKSTIDGSETDEVFQTDAKFKLLRIAGGPIEEVVCGSHIALHKRTPNPIEMLFCDSETSKIDVEDFLNRWFLFPRSSRLIQLQNPACATFWLVNVDQLDYPIQVFCMQKLYQLQAELRGNCPKLFLVSIAPPQTSFYISSVMLRDTKNLTEETCQRLSSNIKPIARALGNVYVVHSPGCADGKTESVLRQLVCDRKDENGEDVLHCQLSIDVTPIQTNLKRLAVARPITSDKGIVLHLNIGHQRDPAEISLFLFQYLLVGCWRDPSGYTHPRHAKDTVVIELCNTGRRDERERISMTRYLQQLPLCAGISSQKVLVKACSNQILYSFAVQNARDASCIGPHLLRRYYELYSSGEDSMNFLEVLSEGVVEPEKLMQIVDSLASNITCAQGHLMTTVTANKDEECGKCKEAIPAGAPVVHCGVCNIDRHRLPRCSQNPFPASFLRRYYQFAWTLLNEYVNSFQIWCEPPEDEALFYNQLAFYFVRIILRSVYNMAKPAMSPLEADDLDEHDVDRCEAMTKFEDWRKEPLFVASNNHYSIVSVDEFSPLQYIAQQVGAGSQFHEWLQLNQQYLKPVNRATLQRRCSELAENPYSSDQQEHPLYDLLHDLGCFEGPIRLFNILATLRDRNHGNMKIEDAHLHLQDVQRFLSEKALARLVTCTDLKRECGEYLHSLFGDESLKPRFTLTVDTILRMLAVQIRLICGVPVCIMGETGCGKTEAIGLLSKLSGQNFEVINVQEGLSEADFFDRIQPVIEQAKNEPNERFVVLLDEVNATKYLWTAKDMLCDHICYGVRIPANITFIVILNPWKERSQAQEAAVRDMEVGGLGDYKQTNSGTKETRNLVYQVHRSPETLYSFVWDWGNAATTMTPLKEIHPHLRQKIILPEQGEPVTDELLLATSMVSSLIRKLQDGRADLREDFRRAGDSTEGENYWVQFRTLLVALLLSSQKYIREDVYLNDLSVVSLRDIRKACDLIWLIFDTFLRIQLELEQRTGRNSGNLRKFSGFNSLTVAVQVALVNTYCLRLDSTRRYEYLKRIQQTWYNCRGTLPNVHPEFLVAPEPVPISCDASELYQAFDSLATYIIGNVEVDSGIAVNQALKENTFAILCAVCTNSTVFIVGRPGSTKSRTLEMLCKATEDLTRKENTFLGMLGKTIQKHVVQCSPYTTAHHVHSNARKAALAQVVADRMQHTDMERVNMLVLEEVGATIGSQHNPLMSLHSMIDHGIELDGQHVRIPIVGISNYRLDASKMGRGRVVYRGNPTVADLEKTAKAILHSLDQSVSQKHLSWVKGFADAFNENILSSNDYTWYHGMRDFYGTVSTIRTLAAPLRFLTESYLSTRTHPEFNAHVARWTILINLRGFPDKHKEEELASEILRSFRLEENTPAQWEWKSPDGETILLCNCCARMQLYRLTRLWEFEHPDDPITEETIATLFNQCTQKLNRRAFCEYFDKNRFIPASEVICYSLCEHSSRHVMIFTKANAALFLLFSMKIVRQDQCTVLFQSTSLKDQSTSTSELVQQMMRIKACMREGRVLILVKSRHLYESLLDALNVHYTKDHSYDGEDNLHKTVLSMAGVTQSVFVDPRFRCIVLEDQDELESQVLPPMINRFSKVVLTYGSALNATQRITRDKIEGSCCVQLADRQLNLLEFLIFGFSDESLDSAVCAYSEYEAICPRLCYLFSRKNLRRLSLNLIEGLEGPEVQTLLEKWMFTWQQYQCNRRLIDVAYDALIRDPEPAHLMIITEQIQLEENAVMETIRAIFDYDDDEEEEEGEDEEDEEYEPVTIIPSFHFLNQTTIQDITAALLKLKRRKDESVSVFVLDSTSTSQSVQLDSFLYAVSTQNFEEHHHVVLLVVVADVLSMEQASSFSLVVDQNWAQVYADEIVPRQLEHFTLPEKESLLTYLEQDKLFHEILCEPHPTVKGPPLMLDLILDRDNLTSICQNISLSSEDVRENMAIIERLFTHPECNSLLESVFGLMLHNSQQQEIPFSQWATMALQHAKFTSDSLCSIYMDFLSAYAVRMSVHILGKISQFHSLQLAVFNSPSAEVLSRLMFDPTIVPLCTLDDCLRLSPFQAQRPTDMISKRGYFTFKQQKRLALRFPFSPFLICKLFDKGSDVDAMKIYIQEYELHRLHPDLVRLYVQDAVHVGCGLPLSAMELFRALVSLYHENAFDSILSFHQMVSEDSAWLKQVISFCSLRFHGLDVANFVAVPNMATLHNVASQQGIIPLDRVELFRKVTKNDKKIDWRILRAIGMADTLPCDTEEELMNRKAQLANLHECFREGDVASGVVQVFETAPEFIKFFLFELFTLEDSHDEDRVPLLLKTLTTLQKVVDLGDRLQANESLWCGVAALLRGAVAALFADPELKELLLALDQFIAISSTHFILFSHCVFYVLLENQFLIGALQSTLPQQFPWAGRPVEYTIRYMMCVALVMSILESDEEQEHQLWKPILAEWLQDRPNEQLDLTMFAVRQLSSGGTADIHGAVQEIHGDKLPRVIAEHPILDDILLNLRAVSSLACLPGFSEGLAMACKFAGNTDRDQFQKQWQALPEPGRNAMTGYVPFAPDKITDNQGELHALLLAQTSPAFQQQLTRFGQMPVRGVGLKQLLLHMMVLHQAQHPVLLFYTQLAEQSVRDRQQVRQFRRDVEEALIPKCPRCSQAFRDWDACFAIKCTCGCGFCGYCLADCGTDAHSHVAKNHGNFSAPFEVHQRAFGKIATEKIKQIVAAVPGHLRSLLEVELVRVLQNNEYFVRPEHILKMGEQKQGNALDMPPVVPTLLELFSQFGFFYLHVQNQAADIESLDRILHEIRTHVNRVSALLFDGAATAALKWLHAILDACENDWPGVVTQRRVEEYFKQLCLAHPQTLEFLAAFDRKCAPISQMVQELQMGVDEILERNLPSDEQARKLLSLPRTVFDFHSQFWAHVAANYDTYPIFCEINENRDSISRENESTLRSMRMMQFIGRLVQAATERKVSREQARKEGSFFDFVQSYGEPLTSLKDQFIQDVKCVLPRIARWQCNMQIQETFGHLAAFPDDIKLALFLPTEKDLGILARVLWSGQGGENDNWTSLPNVQNRLHHLIHHNEKTEEHSPYHLTRDEIVSIDFDQLDQLIDTLFVVPGYHDKLAADLRLIEPLIKDGAPQLSSLPSLQSDLPIFSYGLEGLQNLVFTLQRKLEQQKQPLATLPNTVGTCVLNVMKNAPHAGEQISSFCGALLVQLIGEEGGAWNEALQVPITIPLTEEQQNGQQILLELPGVAGELYVRHLPALISLCWSKKPTIHDSADQDVSEEESERIVSGLRQLKDQSQYHPELPALLTSLRFFGMTLFATEQTGDYLNAPLSVYLENSIFDHDDFLERLMLDHTLHCTPVRYFGTLYRTAEELFAPIEFVLASQVPSKVIPFAAVRQFLRSQRVTEREEDAPARAEEYVPRPEEPARPLPAAEQRVAPGFAAEIVWDKMDDLAF